MIPESVRDRLSDVQAEALDAVREYGGKRTAAKALGKDYRNFCRLVDRAEKVLALAGWSPDHDMVKPTAPGFGLRGTSTLYTIGKDGQEKISAQWVKTSRLEEKIAEMQRAAIEEFSDNVKPLKPTKRKAKPGNSDLLNLFVVTDYHLGSRSWPEETRGDPWDTAIAEDLLTRWFEAAIQSSPNAETAVLAQLGDFVDYDGQVPVTPTSGHVMDADSRFQKLVRVAIRVLRRVIQMLLEKHQHVHVIMAEGNHDIASSVWLREGFHALYENEPRVTIDRSPDPYYCYEHGQTSLFLHHGHLKTPKDIDSVFAAKFRDVFGRTKHSFAHLGHRHHVEIKETNLMVVEQHRTLCARNAHESRGGWVSGRDAKVVTYHKEHGRVAEQVISPEMV